MIEVDARGLSCPEPLMLTDQAMKKHPGESIKVVVTEAHSKTNVEKFAKSKGRSAVSYTHLEDVSTEAGSRELMWKATGRRERKPFTAKMSGRPSANPMRILIFRSFMTNI